MGRSMSGLLKGAQKASRALPTAQAPASAGLNRVKAPLVVLPATDPRPWLTKADHETWQLLLERTARQLSRYESRIHPSYLAGFGLLFQQSRSIPTVEELNAKLRRFKWKTVLVDGYIPHHAYARLLAARTFPVARHIRNRNDVDHSPVPDLAHDVIGHLPMLLDRQHRELLRRVGRVMSRVEPDARDDRLFAAQQRAGYLRQTALHSPAMLRAADDEVASAEAAVANSPSPIALLSRLYLWTIEFGLLGGPDAWVAYGAALMSSSLELQQLMSGRARVLPLTIDVLKSGIAFCDPQRRYYWAQDCEHVHRVLDCVSTMSGLSGIAFPEEGGPNGLASVRA